VIVTVVLTLAIAVPVSVWASHDFNDVPSGHPFHAPISAVADAGITTGFGDGGFHPSDPVTRQAMAAFLERGLGRIAQNSTFDGFPFGVPILPDASTRLTGILLDAGATGGGNAGYAQLTGTASFKSSAPADCPCYIELSIRDLTSGESLGSVTFDVDGDANASGTAVTSATVQGTYSIPADQTGSFALVATLSGSTTSITAPMEEPDLRTPSR